MNRKWIQSVLFVTMTGAAVLGSTTAAHATITSTNPFGNNGAFAYLVRNSTAHYVVWLPGYNPICTQAVYHNVGPAAGLNDSVQIVGGAGPDQLYTWSAAYGSNLCTAYNISPPIVVADKYVELKGGGGTDYLLVNAGSSGKFNLTGGADGDRLISYSSTQAYLVGEDGDDKLCGCSTTSAAEIYTGNAGYDCFYDRNNSYAGLYYVEGTSVGCGCSC